MITALPTPPQRSDSANFAARADAFLTALPTFGVEANALASDVNSKQSLAASAANTATTQAQVATTAANTATTKAAEASTSANSALAYAQAAQAGSGVPAPVANKVLATNSSNNVAWRDFGLYPDTLQNLPTIRPSLLLDFANSKSIDPRITFTRASAATRTNANGLIETVAANVPRIDFDPVTGACKGLLVEEQRTNLLTYSTVLLGQFNADNTLTVTTNAVTSPDGGVNASKFVPNTTLEHHRLRFWDFGSVITANKTYTLSIFAKAGEYKFIFFSGLQGIASTPIFDLEKGIASGTNTYMYSAGDGWWRCICVYTAPGAPVSGNPYWDIRITPSASITTTYTGDGTSGLYIWGAQLEVGSFPTSYIPTTTAQVTRAADVASMTGANFSSWYRQDEGTLFVESSKIPKLSGYSFVSDVSDGTTNNRVSTLWGDSDSMLFSSAQVAGAYAVFGIGLSGLTQSAVVKAATGYKLNDYAISINGSSVSTDTSATVPSVNQIQLGAQVGGTVHLNGHLRRIAYYPKRLANAELQALTTP